MVGMLQILTWLFAFYLVIKGIEILQIGLACGRPDRGTPIIVGAVTLAACILAAVVFVDIQDKQAAAVGTPMHNDRGEVPGP